MLLPRSALPLLAALLPACSARAAPPSPSLAGRVDATLSEQVDRLLDRSFGKGGLLDRGLGAAEDGIASLRARVREDRLPSRRRTAGGSLALDAAVAGCVSGFLCGKIVVGDPVLMAVVGAVGAAAATRWPEPDPRALKRRTAGSFTVGVAYDGARLVQRLRGTAARQLEQQMS